MDATFGGLDELEETLGSALPSLEDNDEIKESGGSALQFGGSPVIEDAEKKTPPEPQQHHQQHQHITYCVKGREDDTFTISAEALDLVPTFKQGSASQSNSTMLISPVEYTDTPQPFMVNTYEHHAFLREYLRFWKDHIAKEDYISQEIIPQVHPATLLKPFDLLLLQKYEKSMLPAQELSTLGKFRRIAVFAPLLQTLYGILGMKGVYNKIMAYVAIIINNCNADDIRNAHEFPEMRADFIAMQERAEEEWYRQNPGAPRVECDDLTSVGDLDGPEDGTLGESADEDEDEGEDED